MTYRGCPTCADVDEWGRAPIGECGPDCVRRKRRLAALAEGRTAMAGFHRGRAKTEKARRSSPTRKDREAPVRRSMRRFLNPSPVLRVRKHGTRSAYVAGCRCDECRDAEAIYSRNRKATA